MRSGNQGFPTNAPQDYGGEISSAVKQQFCLHCLFGCQSLSEGSSGAKCDRGLSCFCLWLPWPVDWE